MRRSTDPTVDTEIRHYQIGAVATRTGLSHQTLRHWDEVGLISPSLRSEGGFRLYSETDIERILVIRRMKPLQFSLTEMSHLLEAFDRLDDPLASDLIRDEAAEFLHECSDRVQQSIVQLGRQLSYAAELASILTDKTRAYRPT